MWHSAPTGRSSASAGDDRMVKIWDVATGREICTLEGHTRQVYSVAFSPDGRWLASGSEDESVKVWNARPLESKSTNP